MGEEQVIRVARRKAAELGYDVEELTTQAVTERGVVRVMFYSTRRDRRGGGVEVTVDLQTNEVTEVRHYQ